MMLFKTIDNLFVGTKYGVWGMSVLGIVFSVVLALANFGMGIGAVAIFIATFCLSISLMLLLLPKGLEKGKKINKYKYGTAILLGVIALSITGIVYFTNGGFPELNLLFA
ncbi:hypothetical protein ACFFIF_07720 [Vagococcus entomophilus]|uniref:Uncharacterized protein n=1 Tax=Vagococcus entomophilus TaxID=1160095 RepID=A0A430AHE9_9ENTE|nr:hypothetical protein [Vagococcus entomophilus]RSU07340.1 hypothetical protein CBF30_08815 [Vagococcus entomophilus]